MVYRWLQSQFYAFLLHIIWNSGTVYNNIVVLLGTAPRAGGVYQAISSTGTAAKLDKTGIIQYMPPSIYSQA
jgi:hypothetical protein